MSSSKSLLQRCQTLTGKPVEDLASQISLGPDLPSSFLSLLFLLHLGSGSALSMECWWKQDKARPTPLLPFPCTG